MRRALFLLVCLAVAVPAFAIWPFSHKTYTLTVVGGSGSGTYASGAKVPIAAAVPPGAFVAWLSGGPTAWGSRPSDFQNPNAATTVFTMPNHAETIQATYTGP